MDFAKSLYKNRSLSLILVSIEIFINYIQLLAITRNALPLDKGRWDHQAKSFLDWLFGHFMIGDERIFTTLFPLGCVMYGGLLGIFLLFYRKIFKINSEEFSWYLLLILIFDHICLGLTSTLATGSLFKPQYCDFDSHLIEDASTVCWKNDHMRYWQFGLTFSSFGLILNAGICPILRAERNGVERFFGNHILFPTVFRVIQYAHITIFVPIWEPSYGIVCFSCMIIYLFIYEGYEEIHISSMFMGTLFGMLWAYISAKCTMSDSYTGSRMLLIGCMISFIIGYSVLYLKRLVIPRKPFEARIDKTESIFS